MLSISSRLRRHPGFYVRPVAAKFHEMFTCCLAAEMRAYRTIMLSIKLLSDIFDVQARAKPCQFIGALDSTFGAH